MADREEKIIIKYDTNADETSKKIDKTTKKIDKSTEATDKKTEATKESTKATTKNTKSSKQQAAGFEAVNVATGGAVRGIRGLIKQMWLLVANPVGAVIAAVVLALTALFKAFTSTKAGAEKMDQIMAGISATIDVLRDRVLLVGEAILKFFQGDFSESMDLFKDSVSGLGDEIAREFKIVADATKSLQEVTDATRDLSVSRAKLDRDLSKSKEIIDDVTASYEDKKKAIEEVKIAEAAQTKLELENAQKKLDAIVILNAQSDSGAEDLDKEAQARIALFNIQKVSADNALKIAKTAKKADNEERARLKSLSTEELKRLKLIADEKKRLQAEEDKINKIQQNAEKKHLEALQNLQDKSAEEKLARQRERAVAEIEALEKQGVDIREITRTNNEKFNQLEDELKEKRDEEQEEKELQRLLRRREVIKQNEDEAAADKIQTEQNIQDALFSITSNGQNLIQSLEDLGLKKSKASEAIRKGLALTQIAADSAVAISTAIPMALQAGKEAAKIAGPAAAVVGPAVTAASLIGSLATVASNVAQAKKILSGGGSISASSASVGAVPTSAAPQVDFQASSENQIATTIAENTNEQQPVKAFVVTSEITTGQELDRKAIESNSF